MDEIPMPLLIAPLLPLAAVGLMLLWASQLKRRGGFDGGVGRLHGLGRYFDSPRSRELALDLAALGSSTNVTLFSGLFALLFLVDGQWLSAVLLVGATSLAGASGTSLKRLTRRVRPGGASTPHFGSSFPSSHTLMGSTLYGSAAVLFAPAATPGLAVFAGFAAVLIALLIGASRVVLRVHYVSDVVAGWWVAASLVAAVALLHPLGATA